MTNINDIIGRLVAAEICEVYGEKREAFTLDDVNGDTKDRAMTTAKEILSEVRKYLSTKRRERWAEDDAREADS